MTLRQRDVITIRFAHRCGYNEQMPESDMYISVEADEVDWKELLQVVRDKQQSIHILSKGQRIAELTPPSDKRRLEPADPRLKVEFAPDYDPTAGISEEDWPLRSR